MSNKYEGEEVHVNKEEDQENAAKYNMAEGKEANKEEDQEDAAKSGKEANN